MVKKDTSQECFGRLHKHTKGSQSMAWGIKSSCEIELF